MGNEKKLTSFSVIIPTFNRENLVQRAIKSVQNQIYEGDCEIIVVDDGSTDKTKGILRKLAEEDKRIEIVSHERRRQRQAARNTGMKKASKNWICWLDADDEYLRSYLTSLNWAINEYPEYKVFHFGALVCRLRRYHIREAADIKEEGNHMERFKSGSIGAGSFVFHRSCLDKVGYLPEAINAYLFADAAKEEMPEIMEWYGKKYMEGGKELGNPHGDDWYMFYKLTREYKSKSLPFLIYIQYVRRGGFIRQDEDFK